MSNDLESCGGKISFAIIGHFTLILPHNHSLNFETTH